MKIFDAGTDVMNVIVTVKAIWNGSTTRWTVLATLDSACPQSDRRHFAISTDNEHAALRVASDLLAVVAQPRGSLTRAQARRKAANEE